MSRDQVHGNKTLIQQQMGADVDEQRVPLRDAELVRRKIRPEDAVWQEALLQRYPQPGVGEYVTYSLHELPDICVVADNTGSGTAIVTWYVLRREPKTQKWRLAKSTEPRGYMLDLTVHVVPDGEGVRVEARSREFRREGESRHGPAKEVERIDVIASWKVE